MKLSDMQDNVTGTKPDKEAIKRQLLIEYIKGVVIVLVFLVGLAFITNFVNIYYAVKFSEFHVRPWYANFVLLLSIAAYILAFMFVYKHLGFKITDKIDDLKTIRDNLA